MRRTLLRFRKKCEEIGFNFEDLISALSSSCWLSIAIHTVSFDPSSLEKLCDVGTGSRASLRQQRLSVPAAAAQSGVRPPAAPTTGMSLTPTSRLRMPPTCRHMLTLTILIPLHAERCRSGR